MLTHQAPAGLVPRDVTLREGELPALLAALRSRELDLALVFSQPGEPLDLGDEFVVHPLVEDPLLLVLPADHPQAGLAHVPLTALREDGWIMGTTDWDPCDRLLSWACAREGFEPVRVMRTDDYGVLQGFVAAGVGVALVPRLGLGSPPEGQRDPAGRRTGAGPADRCRRTTDHLGPQCGQLLAALRTEAERIAAGNRGAEPFPAITSAGDPAGQHTVDREPRGASSSGWGTVPAASSGTGKSLTDAAG
ncbi:LysR substrate-binding domain-containing protein [Streptomyces lydicus]|uniref:LysR substrate-binding domain-containing protein n=1 Tax=Streptomyces lydicus TaxID=47763 RepID=UPI0037AD87FD